MTPRSTTICEPDNTLELSPASHTTTSAASSAVMKSLRLAREPFIGGWYGIAAKLLR